MENINLKMELIILIWKDENKKGTFTQIIIQIKVCFYEKKKKKDLPIDYQTGSCHGEKKKKTMNIGEE